LAIAGDGAILSPASGLFTFLIRAANREPNIGIESLGYIYYNENKGDAPRPVSLFVGSARRDARRRIARCMNLDDLFDPKVSIVIPVYNGGNFMREAIDSALGQTYSNIEVIVVNDGSADDGETEAIALSYGERIRYFSKPNGGVATALNYGVEKMTGEYFSWLSHDDVYAPEKIQAQIQLLSGLEDKTTLVSSAFTIIDTQGKELYRTYFHQEFTKDQLRRPLFALLRGCVNGCALLIHRSHFERVGLFDVRLPTTQDFDLWFRMMRGKPMVFHEGHLLKSRSHEDQDSKKKLAAHVSECNALWIGFMKTLTEEEMCEIDRSPYWFYKNTHDFLANASAYHEAVLYAEAGMLRALKKDIVAADFSERKKLLTYAKKDMELQGTPALRGQGALTAVTPKQKPRILFYADDRNTLGGLNRVVFTMAGALCDQYEVCLLNNSEYNGEGYLVDERVRRLVFPYEAQYFTKLGRLLCLWDVDVFVGSHNCIPEFLLIYEQIQAYQVKTIAWCHEFYFLPYWRSDLYACLSARNSMLRNADVSLWLNSFSANAYALLNDGNAAWMPNPLTIQQPVTKQKKSGSRNIIAVARFDDPQKRLDYLLIVFSKVLYAFPDAALTLLGPYDLDISLPNTDTGETYRDLIMRLRISYDRIQFIGWTKDVDAYYRKAAVHVLASNYEAFGLVITEAAAYGVPSVVFDESGFEDIITDGQDGFVVPLGDTDAMAGRIIQLFEDRERLKEMGLAAQEMAKRFDLAVITRHWERLIEALLIMEKSALQTYLKQEFWRPMKDTDRFMRQLAREYEAAVLRMISHANLRYTSNMDLSLINNNQIPAVVSSCAECEAMKRTLSWRITKPLRLVRKWMLSIRASGWRVTSKKTLSYCKRLFHKTR
jgi:glycosyltransferase involved in cell wall biosynthesis